MKQFKKFFILLLCLITVAGLCACNKDDNANNNDATNKDVVTEELATKEETTNKINKYLKEFKDIEDTKIRLIKYGSYYKLELGLDVKSNMSLRRITNLENKVRKGIIRHRTLNVKYVSIYVTNNLEK